MFSLKTEDTKYESLSNEKYYTLLKELISLSYEDFVSLCQ